MPQASDELRLKWGGERGVGEDKAIAFLEERGWEEVGNGLWRRPSVRVADFRGESDEEEAFAFLVHEWDHALAPAL
jgi:hypothetical protein